MRESLLFHALVRDEELAVRALEATVARGSTVEETPLELLFAVGTGDLVNSVHTGHRASDASRRAAAPRPPHFQALGVPANVGRSRALPGGSLTTARATLRRKKGAHGGNMVSPMLLDAVFESLGLG